MSIWFDSLGTLGKVFFCIATPASIILLLQIVLSLVGIGQDGDFDVEAPDDAFDVDVDADVDADALSDVADLQLFSLRSIISFFVTFGWMGVSLVKTNLHEAWVVVISLAAGVVVMLTVAYLMRALYRLQSDGTSDIRKAVGMVGTVYMNIPASRAAKGKINVMIGDRLEEREAVTDDETPLTFGTEVIVLSVTGGNTLVVTKK
ncbi:MAG: hypothetical protein J6V22_06010 [Clostridia bacterium]|nr:hypothetical protein [Clostridia bacterium]